MYKTLVRKNPSTYLIEKLNVRNFAKASEAPQHLQSLQKFSEHEDEVRAALIGNILGDAYVDRRGKKTRLQFLGSIKHKTYLLFLHNFYSTRGYCSKNVPQEFNQLHYSGNTYGSFRFGTYFFTSFNDIHDIFYRQPTDEELSANLKNKRKLRYIKRIPNNINEYLTPRALAFWFMDDGSFHKEKGYIRIATNSFCMQDIELLKNALKDNFNLNWLIQKQKRQNDNIQFTLYLSRNQVELLIPIIKPFMVGSMYYKLGLDPFGNKTSK
jgi:hypothetical protein